MKIWWHLRRSTKVLLALDTHPVLDGNLKMRFSDLVSASLFPWSHTVRTSSSGGIWKDPLERSIWYARAITPVAAEFPTETLVIE